jgi:hypothetical protein
MSPDFQEVMMQQIYSDNLTDEDQKAARRIYLGLASCYAGLLLLLGALLIFNLSDRGSVQLASEQGREASSPGLFSAMAADNPDRARCAARDLKLLTAINEHGEAQDLPADDIRNAFFALVKARGVCAAGRVEEALAMYDSVVMGASKTAQK